MKNGKILLLMGLVFMIALSTNALAGNEFSSFNTTHGGKSNPSKIPADYNVCGGLFSDRTLCTSFKNNSVWVNITTTAEGVIDVSDEEVNFTSNGNFFGGANALRILTGRLANNLSTTSGTASCLAFDFQLIMHDYTSGINFLGIY